MDRTETADDDHVYLSLTEEHGDTDTRWAFGTGFADPLHGVDTTLPDGVDAAELAVVCLALGDDALVAAQRLAEWCTRAPELEEEVALANIGLDLLGQARMLYARCGQVDGTDRGEDAYAYFRDPGDFRNVALAELPNGDFAFTVARLLVLATWRLALLGRLAAGPDPVLAAIAAKAVPELTYHRQYAADWVVRLGDGTEESHRRMRAALEDLAPYIEEVLNATGTAVRGAQAARPPMPTPHRSPGPYARRRWAYCGRCWQLPVSTCPSGPRRPTGPHGEHTEHLAPLLEELQSVARAHPEATW